MRTTMQYFSIMLFYNIMNYNVNVNSSDKEFVYFKKYLMLKRLIEWQRELRQISEKININSSIEEIEEEYEFHKNLTRNVENDYLINIIKKLELLQKLSEIKTEHAIKLSRNYDLNSNYDDMKFEYDYHKNEIDKQNFIGFANSFFCNASYGIEMLNDKYMGNYLNLKGFSEIINQDIGTNKLDEHFENLYEKYYKNNKNNKKNTELNLGVYLFSQILKTHLVNNMMSKTELLNNFNTKTKFKFD